MTTRIGCEPGTGNLVFVTDNCTFKTSPEAAEQFAQLLKRRSRLKNPIKTAVVDVDGKSWKFQCAHEQAMAMYRLIKMTLDLVPQAMAMKTEDLKLTAKVESNGPADQQEVVRS